MNNFKDIYDTLTAGISWPTLNFTLGIMLSINLIYVIASYFFKNFFDKTLAEKKHNLEVFKSQLDNLNKLNQDYYVVYITNTQALKKQLEKEIIDESFLFYEFLKLIDIRRRWIEEVHSLIILKSHTAEKLIIHLIQDQILFSDTNLLEKDERYKLIMFLRAKSAKKGKNKSLSPREFHRMLEDGDQKNNELEKIYINFQKKIRSLDRNTKEFKNLLANMDIFARIFDSEVYHCHEAWYKNTYYPPTFTKEQQIIITEKLITLFNQRWVRLAEVNSFLGRIESFYKINILSKKMFAYNRPHHVIRNLVSFFLNSQCFKIWESRCLKIWRWIVIGIRH